MFASSSSAAEDVWYDVRNRLAAAKDERFDTVRDEHCAAFKTRLHRKREDVVLAEKELLDGFPKDGDKEFRAELWNKMSAKYTSIELCVTFLVAGFDEHDDARLFTISDPGIHENHTKHGFVAIGVGRTLAATSLTLKFPKEEKAPTLDLEDLIYYVCFAKFDSESAPDVSKTTFVTVHDAQGKWQTLSNATITRVKEEWARPKIVPPDIRQAIGNSLLYAELNPGDGTFCRPES
jgi:hypothetical protein